MRVSRNRNRQPVAEPPPPTHVEINLGNHHIVVEAAEPMETVIAAAMKLFADTGSNRDPHAGGEQFGFAMPVLSDAVGQQLSGPEIPLPNRMIPWEGPDDRRGKQAG